MCDASWKVIKRKRLGIGYEGYVGNRTADPRKLEERHEDFSADTPRSRPAETHSTLATPWSFNF